MASTLLKILFFIVKKKIVVSIRKKKNLNFEKLTKIQKKIISKFMLKLVYILIYQN
jgi:uncharacterized membrane protein